MFYKNKNYSIIGLGPTNKDMRNENLDMVISNNILQIHISYT